ncbi:hypothetical protein [Undibacter mobilis]|uniref:Uncharacterized protein n=1 Tax=Undibacter mobilis TaxID=2292256 RepID=A0A371BAC7_9BRAD|nr:hypothetical protein [Undibacter mobilis]RDV04514.1 hypothetical protein DXH78_08025 [Undibacter mobilis]
MENANQEPSKFDLANKILKWPKDHPLLALLAVTTMSLLSFLASGPSGGVEACNDPGVVQTLQNGLTEKMASGADALSKRPEARMFAAVGAPNILNEIKSITATVSAITQTGFDKDNRVRSCEGNVTYASYREAHASVFPLLGTRLCSGTVQFKISRPLDMPKNYSINWQCD